MSVCSSAMSGAGMVCQYKAIQKQPDGYMYCMLWWLGYLVIAVGSVFGIFAYSYAPAMVLAPLNGLTIFFTCVFSCWLLRHPLERGITYALIDCVLGSLIIIIPIQTHVVANVFEELSVGFRLYSTGVALLLVLGLWLRQHTEGQSTAACIWALSISSVVTVILCKGLGVYVEYYGLSALWYQPIAIGVMLSCVLLVILQSKFLNQCLAKLSALQVIANLYVISTMIMFGASWLIFEELEGMETRTVILVIIGFVFMLKGILDLQGRVRLMPVYRPLTCESYEES